MVKQFVILYNLLLSFGTLLFDTLDIYHYDASDGKKAIFEITILLYLKYLYYARNLKLFIGIYSNSDVIWTEEWSI